MARADIVHKDLKPAPYWWEAYKPVARALADVPREARVAIIGGGYAGLACAIDLADAGVGSCVLDASEPGFGASTRNGGMVSGGVNIGKSFTGKVTELADDQKRELLSSAADAFALVEALIKRERIECHWQHRGRFQGAWTPRDYAVQEKSVAKLNDLAQSGSYMVPRGRQREEIGSDYYYGGMVVERSASLHPALYYQGLHEAARRRGVTICSMARAGRIEPHGKGWRIETARGTLAAGDVVIATNGYTGGVTPALQRHLIPVASHIIATEELPPELAASISPKGRTLSETKRVLCYYRLSPDGRRMIFGGRARFTSATPEVSAPILHRFMTDRFPQLRGAKVTHAWTGNVAFTFDALPHTGRMDGLHYALGCNGSGVAVMTYMGTQTARRIIGGTNRPCGFELAEFPDFPLYRGDCGHTTIAYCSCRNRHCPKCQGSQALEWLVARKAELLEVPYFHVVFTLPPRIAAIAYQNKAVIYDLLFKASSETLLTLAADPKRLGVKIGFTSVLHTWGSAMTHHPHVHMIVPGGGLTPNGAKWIGSSEDFLLPVPVLTRMFRGKMLAMLKSAHADGKLQFFGPHIDLTDKARFKAWLEPLYDTHWHVYAKRPFAGPEQVLAYLARYTHRVTISSKRLVGIDEKGCDVR